MSNQRKNSTFLKFFTALTLFISTGLLVILTNFPALPMSPLMIPLARGGLEWGAFNKVAMISNAKPHPLPSTLIKWEDKQNSGDYFSQIAPTSVGYLIWSQFPVKVKIEAPTGVNEKQAQMWMNRVLSAVQEWNIYLPLVVVKTSEIADITIRRKTPPLQISPDAKIPRARSAQTSYELYTKNHVLFHRFSILLSPNQTGDYVEAAARHELGHALGIWGHSQLETDALYFSQVRKPAIISVRDVNTLKRVYEQSTGLGWFVMEKD